jgi:malonyl-CoA decarboxylase
LTDRSHFNVSFLQDLLHSAVEQGRVLVDRTLSARGPWSNTHTQTIPRKGVDGPEALTALLKKLVSGRGEASGVALAHEIMQRYKDLNGDEKTRVLGALNRLFAPDPEAIRHAYRLFEQAPSAATLQSLSDAVEPPRQEVIRRLNLAPGNTLELVRMRADLLARLPEYPDLASLDSDFRHLFSSWFNRGFLVIRRIDWTTPAYILEKIIRYEAVHAIESWDDLRRRIEPWDRRCFAFFHPALLDEPLIFVEVALTRSIASAIHPILTADRDVLPQGEPSTAMFYSISNCQKGLSQISFGSFLIKQVAEELKRELPDLTTFATLSPVPGFRRWLESEETMRAMKQVECAELAALALDPAPDALVAAEPVLRRMLMHYMLEAKDADGQPRDPVARFHLGNGARLERLNPGADLSAKGLGESYGAMVNYLYDLALVEHNHERYATHGEVVASQQIRQAHKQRVT